MKTKIEIVKALHLRPGDYVIVELNEANSAKAEVIAQDVQARFPKQEVVVAFGGIRLKFAREVKK